MATMAERRAQLLTKAANYRRTALQVHDTDLTSAYLKMAREANEQAEALRPRTSAPVSRRTTWKGTHGQR